MGLSRVLISWGLSRLSDTIYGKYSAKSRRSANVAAITPHLPSFQMDQPVTSSRERGQHALRFPAALLQTYLRYPHITGPAPGRAVRANPSPGLWAPPVLWAARSCPRHSSPLSCTGNLPLLHLNVFSRTHKKLQQKLTTVKGQRRGTAG